MSQNQHHPRNAYFRNIGLKSNKAIALVLQSDRLSSESRYPNKNLSLTIARFNRFPQRQRDRLINYLLHTCCINPVGKFERRAKQEPSLHLPRHTCTFVAVFQS